MISSLIPQIVVDINNSVTDLCNQEKVPEDYKGVVFKIASSILLNTINKATDILNGTNKKADSATEQYFAELKDFIESSMAINTHQYIGSQGIRYFDGEEGGNLVLGFLKAYSNNSSLKEDEDDGINNDYAEARHSAFDTLFILPMLIKEGLLDKDSCIRTLDYFKEIVNNLKDCKSLVYDKNGCLPDIKDEDTKSE